MQSAGKRVQKRARSEEPRSKNPPAWSFAPAVYRPERSGGLRRSVTANDGQNPEAHFLIWLGMEYTAVRNNVSITLTKILTLFLMKVFRRIDYKNESIQQKELLP